MGNSRAIAYTCKEAPLDRAAELLCIELMTTLAPVFKLELSPVEGPAAAVK